MRKFIHRIITTFILGVVWLVWYAPGAVHASDFLVDFWWPLVSEWGWWDERAFIVPGLSDEWTLIDNLKSIFYPDFQWWGWALWDILKNVAIWILIIMFIWAWASLMFFASNPEDVKSWLMNLLYLIIWAIILFLALWLLWEWLDFSWFTGLSWWTDSVVKKLENDVLLTIIGIFKALAFFVAIIMIVYYGYQMITAFDADEKLKAARTWIMNVLIALLFIKVLDYVYFIALQWSFKTDAIELVVWIAKFLWYFLWIVLVIMMIYAWYLMVTANWDEEQVWKAKNIIKTIFIAVLILMLFLLVIYQIFKDVL